MPFKVLTDPGCYWQTHGCSSLAERQTGAGGKLMVAVVLQRDRQGLVANSWLQ